MSEFNEAIERVTLELCAIPCKNCPVGHLSDDERASVGVVAEDYQRRSLRPSQETDRMRQWSLVALSKATGETVVDPGKVSAVIQAVIRIANGDCTNYTE